MLDWLWCAAWLADGRDGTFYLNDCVCVCFCVLFWSSRDAIMGCVCVRAGVCVRARVWRNVTERAYGHTYTWARAHASDHIHYWCAKTANDPPQKTVSSVSRRWTDVADGWMDEWPAGWGGWVWGARGAWGGSIGARLSTWSRPYMRVRTLHIITMPNCTGNARTHVTASVGWLA